MLKNAEVIVLVRLTLVFGKQINQSISLSVLFFNVAYTKKLLQEPQRDELSEGKTGIGATE